MASLVWLLEGVPASADRCQVWWNPRPQGNDLKAVAGGGGVVVAVGAVGTAVTSPDAVSWTLRLTGSNQTLTDVVVAGGSLVALGSRIESGGGSRAVSFKSDDGGQSWSRHDFPGGVVGATDLAWNGSRFVALTGADIYTSTNAESWTDADAPTLVPLNDVVWAGNKFVVVGNNGGVLESPDGLSWINRDVGSQEPKALAWTGSLLIAVGAGGAVWTSPDAVTWTPGNAGVAATLNDVATNGAISVAVGFLDGTNGLVVSSADGSSWTPRATGSPEGLPRTLVAVAWTGGQFVAVGTDGTSLTSPDGVNWTVRSRGPNRLLDDLAANGSIMVAAGNGVYTSPDGQMWTERVVSASSHQGVTWGNGKFVVVAGSGLVYTSPDGIGWTPQTSNTTAPLYDVAWLGGQYLILGNNLTVVTSPDAVTWTPRNAGTGTLRSVAWNGTRYVAVGSTAGAEPVILTSPTGMTWTPQNVGVVGVHLFGVTWTGTRFVAVGSNGTALTSADGLTWAPGNVGTTRELRDVVSGFDRVVAVAFGSGSDTPFFHSPDGLTWQSDCTGAAEAFNGVAWDGSRYLGVGGSGMILELERDVPLFADGFEAGNASAWSLRVP